LNKTDKPHEKQVARLLNFLFSTRMARVSEFGPDQEGGLLLAHPTQSQRKILTTRQIIDRLVASDLIASSAGSCRLTPAGVNRVKRQRMSLGSNTEFQSQHLDIVVQQELVDGQRHTVNRNQNESPLARLRARNDKQGQPWLNAAQFSAGERLRQDFTRAQLATSVTSNWRSPVQAMNRSSGGGGGSGGLVDLSDSALDARQRFNRALEFVGPDLANVLTDVCCYLKGLQTVERELRWPPRSAKLMLRTGLELLSQFYGTQAGQRRRTPTSTTGRR